MHHIEDGYDWVRVFVAVSSVAAFIVLRSGHAAAQEEHRDPSSFVVWLEDPDDGMKGGIPVVELKSESHYKTVRLLDDGQAPDVAAGDARFACAVTDLAGERFHVTVRLGEVSGPVLGKGDVTLPRDKDELAIRIRLTMDGIELRVASGGSSPANGKGNNQDARGEEGGLQDGDNPFLVRVDDRAATLGDADPVCILYAGKNRRVVRPRDDGVPPDESEGDGVYSIAVSGFPATDLELTVFAAPGSARTPSEWRRLASARIALDPDVLEREVHVVLNKGGAAIRVGAGGAPAPVSHLGIEHAEVAPAAAEVDAEPREEKGERVTVSNGGFEDAAEPVAGETATSSSGDGHTLLVRVRDTEGLLGNGRPVVLMLGKRARCTLQPLDDGHAPDEGAGDRVFSGADAQFTEHAFRFELYVDDTDGRMLGEGAVTFDDGAGERELDITVTSSGVQVSTEKGAAQIAAGPVRTPWPDPEEEATSASSLLRVALVIVAGALIGLLVGRRWK